MADIIADAQKTEDLQMFQVIKNKWQVQLQTIENGIDQLVAWKIDYPDYVTSLDTVIAQAQTALRNLADKYDA